MTGWGADSGCIENLSARPLVALSITSYHFHLLSWPTAPISSLRTLKVSGIVNTPNRCSLDTLLRTPFSRNLQGLRELCISHMHLAFAPDGGVRISNLTDYVSLEHFKVIFGGIGDVLYVRYFEESNTAHMVTFHLSAVNDAYPFPFPYIVHG